MSSTNRGGKRSDADFYTTPAWAVHRILTALPDLPRTGVWLDPCAGDGAIIKAARALEPDTRWKAVELRDECALALEEIPECVTLIGDYLSEDTPIVGHASVVLMNPPYRLAQDFIVKAMKTSKHVVALLRLNFLGSEGRSEFMRQWAPDVYVLPNRPKFQAGSGTDSIEYAWFVWDSGVPRSVGTIRVLPSTQKLERGVYRRGGKLPAEVPDDRSGSSDEGVVGVG